jgi:hypothetical protein
LEIAMKRIISILCAAALACSTLIAFGAPASAAHRHHGGGHHGHMHFGGHHGHFGRHHFRGHHFHGHHGYYRHRGFAYYNGYRGYPYWRRGYREYNGFWFPAAAFAAIIGGAVGGYYPYGYYPAPFFFPY